MSRIFPLICIGHKELQNAFDRLQRKPDSPGGELFSGALTIWLPTLRFGCHAILFPFKSHAQSQTIKNQQK